MALRKLATFENERTGYKATVYRDGEWMEYRVKFSPGTAGADYHTSDKGDALETASAYAWPLNPHWTAALAEFKARHGRRWRDELSLCWYRAGYPGMTDATAGALQSLRNTYGPQWLSQQQGA